MLLIGDVLVSLDILEKKFCCDLSVCHGVCCLEGDAGAPLDEKEVEEIKAGYEDIRLFMRAEGVKVVEEQGFAVLDREGDTVTPLIEGRECAYSVVENGTFLCAIEKACLAGKGMFRKPKSCYLYPIRVSVFGGREALNYHQWEVCDSARLKGEKEGVPLYRFLQNPLIARYGLEWYDELELAAREWERENKSNFEQNESQPSHLLAL
ncbi:hypothetical protein FACS1894199_01890 [Bacteroidia bacterium]|nr:hypothetical protein FACS1894199_01890 [Bacteroidia bacterium]